MTDNERKILECSVLFLKEVFRKREAFDSFKQRFKYLDDPYVPLEHETIEAACYRIFGTSIYNSVFNRTK